jgi:hypothetical protein
MTDKSTVTTKRGTKIEIVHHLFYNSITIIGIECPANSCKNGKTIAGTQIRFPSPGEAIYCAKADNKMASFGCQN